ncbi:MAG: response regulator transcription factor [Tannerellaceae bacterium]
MHVEDFFLSSNTIFNIPKEAYQNTHLIIETVDAIARMTNQSHYIIDYHKHSFLYVSRNPLFLCGYTVEEVQQMGYQFFLQQVPAHEQSMLIKINKAGFDFYQKTPIQERTKFSISYNFHLLNGNRKTLINHKLTPLCITNDGKVWLAACVVSLASRDTVGEIKIQESGNNQIWEYSLESKIWSQTKKVELNEKEKRVLSLSAQGYTMKEIADKMHLSIDSIKLYRRKLSEKLDTKNITEALAYVANHNL